MNKNSKNKRNQTESFHTDQSTKKKQNTHTTDCYENQADFMNDWLWLD